MYLRGSSVNGEPKASVDLSNFDRASKSRLRCAPHGRSWTHYVVGIVLHAMLFALTGPAIGAVAAGIVTGWIILAPFIIAFAYMSNTGAAAVGGACFAIATSFVVKPWKLYAIAGITGGVSAATLGSLGPRSGELVAILLLAFFGAIASIVCARLVRSLRLRADNPYFASSCKT